MTAQMLCHPCDKRGFWSNNHEINLFFLNKTEDQIGGVDVQIMALCNLCNPCVSPRTKERIAFWVLRNRPNQCVFSAAAA